jgi:hypothetical protein
LPRITEEIDAMMDELCEFIAENEDGENIREEVEDLYARGKHRKALNAMFEVDIFMLQGQVLRDKVIRAMLKKLLEPKKSKKVAAVKP